LNGGQNGARGPSGPLKRLKVIYSR